MNNRLSSVLKILVLLCLIAFFIFMAVVLLSLMYGPREAEEHTGVVAVEIVGADGIHGEIHENYKWTNVYFYCASKDEKFIRQPVTLRLQNGLEGKNLLVAPLIETTDTTGVVIQPGKSADIYRGPLENMLNANGDRDAARKRGIGIAGLESPKIRARVRLDFDAPQPRENLEKIAIKTWWRTPGSID